MSAIKRYYEDLGYTIGSVIREDLPGWQEHIEEDDENGSLEDQVVNLLLTCQFDHLLFILWDLTTELPYAPERALEAINTVFYIKKQLNRRIDTVLLKGELDA